MGLGNNKTKLFKINKIGEPRIEAPRWYYGNSKKKKKEKGGICKGEGAVFLESLLRAAGGRGGEGRSGSGSWERMNYESPLQRWRGSLVLTHGCSAACRVCVKDSASVLVGILQAYALRNFEYTQLNIENEYAICTLIYMQILYVMIYHHQHICKVPQVYSSLKHYTCNAHLPFT